MARRKGVSKTKNAHGRKITSETSHPPREDDRLKNDPGGTSPHDMDETRLISSKKVQNYKINNIRNNDDNQSNRQSPVDPVTHRQDSSKLNSSEKDTIDAIRSDHNNKSSQELINSKNSNNNNTSKTIINNSSNDLKYLHKKFKRIASATFEDEVQNHRQSIENIVVDDNRDKSTSKSISSKDNITSNNSNNCTNKDQNQYILVNGNAQPQVRVSISTDGIKGVFLTPEINGDYIERQRTYSPHIRVKSANELKYSPKPEENFVNNLLIKPERISPQTNTNHNNNNILNRVPLIPSNLRTSSPSKTVVNVGNNQKIQQQQQQQQQQQPQRSQQREVDQSFSGRHVCPYCNLNCTKPSVLQKHIRAHTNERPYPCDTCGFAFKTKSNYYKHCRSRSHALRMKGGDPQPDDDGSLGSDQDQDPDLSNSSSDVISRTASPMDERTSSPAVQQQAAQSFLKYSNEKPYKPKFHNAALYAKEENTQQKQQHNNHNLNNHFNSTISNYYSPSSHHYHQQQQQHQQQHQQQQPQQQSNELDSSIHFQQAGKNRSEQAPQISQTFQQVASAYPESSSQNRESTSSTFGGLTSTSTAGAHPLNKQRFAEHISKIISQNEAIVESKELLLQKKYPKVGTKTKMVMPSENSTSRVAFALSAKQQQQQREETSVSKATPLQNTSITTNGLPNVSAASQKIIQQIVPNSGQPPETTLSSQPLNLSKINEQTENTRKRPSTESFSVAILEGSAPPQPIKNLSSHPQNPERSIIKHLLLNARGLGVPNGEGDDAVYSCPLCNLEFRSAEDLRLHTSNYCQGGPSSAPISPVASPSYKYFRSNSINVNLPEFNNPNSLAKLARSSLLHLSRNPLSLAKLAWSQLKTKPSNLVLNQLNVNTNTTAGSSSSQTSSESSSSLQKLIDAPLPSPGPLLGKTPLVEAYNNTDRKSEDVIITKVHEENRNFIKELSPKRLRLNNYPQQSYQSLGNENNPSSAGNSLTVFPNSPLLDSPLNKTQQNYIMCGGEVQMLNKKEDRMKRFLSSGGCVIPISECPDLEASPKMIRTPLLSGGSFTEVSPKSGNRDMPITPSSTPKMMIPIAPLTPSLPAPNLLNAGLPLPNHFQFPPINSITAFNPLTLPPVSIVPSSVMHGDKLIPFVPGIPGPNTLAPPPLTHPPQRLGDLVLSRNVSPSRKKTPSPLVQSSMLGSTDAGIQRVSHNQSPRQIPKLCVRVEGDNPQQVELVRPTQRSPRAWTPQSSPAVETVKKSFNFTRMADNLSPRKSTVDKTTRSPEREREVRHFNFENIPKVDIVAPPTTQIQQQQLMPLHVDVSNTTSKNSKEPSETEIAEARSKAKSRFLRPTSLPLKPGTFTPKRHHGITPTANTLPLISPETPRPSKACIQLYLNGHAYTYLGLKCSTKMFYCTVNCPQPSYVANLHKLSMYSVWQVCAENNPHPLGLKPKTVMALYDSRQRSSTSLMATIKSEYTSVHSQPTVMTPFENNSGQFYHHQVKSIQSNSENSGKNGDQNSKSSNSNNVLVGGYESNEDYTYIRGRGRGKYVCSECGIRCKKPSMLKKHIRTHTDVRPYTCQHCSFSFKTKGNLTKHMQSKTHYKKCLELGISPGPIPMDGDFMETDIDMDRQSTISGGGRTSSVPEESDSEDYSDGGDGETESSDTDESKSRLPEHEAARCLLSLSMTPPSAALSQLAHGRSQYGGYHQQQITEYGSSNTSNDNQGLLQPYSSRRVISFTSPKPPFDYQKQEQYYSNPSIIPKGKEDKFDESSMKPIDLTKPRQFDQKRVTDVIGDLANETGLLRSLVFNTDKIRTSVPTTIQAKNLDENILLQAYLTEQALQYSKIKQSQMNKTFPEITTNSSTTYLTTSTVFSTLSCSYDRSSFIRQDNNNSTYSTVGARAFSAVSSTALSQPVTCAQEQNNISFEKSCSDPASTSTVLDHRIEQSQSPFQNQADSKSDAENKSPSRVNPSLFHSTQSQEPISKETNTPRPKVTVPGPGNAKSVASEYLKMTSAEYLKSRNSKNEESEESSSDQEINTVDNLAGSGIKPPSDFSGILARTVIVGEDGFKNSANEVQPMFPRVPISDDGRPVCTICSKTFQKQHQMVLHMNIHYMERKFKCEPCAVSFRTQGHLQKHERSEAHKNKVMMTSTFGVPTTSNPRPFECSDCKVAFRIHGHLAKHLRSKTHVQKLECLQKLPFGTYAEIERAGISLTEIDTTDCDNSLASLKVLAQKLIEKDPSKLGSYTTPSCMENNSSGVLSHESGSEDSPEAQTEITESAREQNDPGSFASSSEGSGVKRKFDSFSSCSNDSLPNTNQPDMAQVEKRPRTTSET